MTLQGSLEDFELTDLLQLIQMGNKDGALKIDAETERGVIYIENGQIKHAEADDTQGEMAITQIIQWKRGNFEFLPDSRTEKRTIGVPIATVILDSARRVDEWKQIEKLVPSLSIIFEIEPNPNTDVDMIELAGQEWRVLSQIDGVKNIREISKQLNMKEFDCAKIFYGLASSGLIKRTKKEIIKEEAKEEKEERKKEKEEKKGLKGFFERFRQK